MKFIEGFYEEQGGRFLSNEDDKFVEIIAALDSNSTFPVLGIINSHSNSRIKVSGTDKLISLSRIEGEDNLSTYGIYFDYDPRRIIKEMNYREEEKVVAISVRANSRFYYFNSLHDQTYISTFRDWTGNIKNPSTKIQATSMDSKSPAHESGGFTGLEGPGQL